MNYVTLTNGVKMPQLGYGVYQVNPAECERCVLDAINTGYRLIDTAQAYHNEEGVGAAVQKCGVPRNELFIVTKIWISNAGEQKAYASILESLETPGILTCFSFISRSATITAHTAPWNALIVKGK